MPGSNSITYNDPFVVHSTGPDHPDRAASRIALAGAIGCRDDGAAPQSHLFQGLAPAHELRVATLCFLERVLLDIAAGHEEICGDPKPRVRFRQFGDSSLDFELLCWITEPVLRGRLLHELHRDVYKQLAVEGIEIPYPKRDVYIKEMPAGR